MATSAAVPASRGHYRVADLVAFEVTLECNYQAMGILWKHALGSVSTTGPVTSYYTHINKYSAGLPTGLTVEIARGTGTSDVCEGCKINTMRFAVAAGGKAILTVGFIGETTAGRESNATPTFTTEVPVLHHQSGVLSWNSGSYTLRSFEWMIDNKLELRQQLGSLVTAEPVRGDAPECKTSFEMEVDDAWTAADVADTASDATLRLTSGSYYLEFTTHNAYVDDVSDPVDKPGMLFSRVSLVGEGDGTDHGASIVYKNLNSSAVSNG
jgi:hypothetical protein